MILYADDSAIICIGKNIENLKEVNFAKLKTGLNEVDWHPIIKKAIVGFLTVTPKKLSSFA